MRIFLMINGMALTIIFGGGFLIRFIRDSAFYIAEFTGGIIGVILLIVSIFAMDKRSQENILSKNRYYEEE